MYWAAARADPLNFRYVESRRSRRSALERAAVARALCGASPALVLLLLDAIELKQTGLEADRFVNVCQCMMINDER